MRVRVIDFVGEVIVALLLLLAFLIGSLVSDEPVRKADKQENKQEVEYHDRN